MVGQLHMAATIQVSTEPDLTLFFLIFTYFIELSEIMAQLGLYKTLFSKITSNFISNYLKKVRGGATTQKGIVVVEPLWS